MGHSGAWPASSVGLERVPSVMLATLVQTGSPSSPVSFSRFSSLCTLSPGICSLGPRVQITMLQAPRSVDVRVGTRYRVPVHAYIRLSPFVSPSGAVNSAANWSRLASPMRDHAPSGQGPDDRTCMTLVTSASPVVVEGGLC